ncbi:MAG TPA: gluconate 2-dehydrogenase subunit 3 family protein [Chloroflexota bacterium]|nr:gluconate 2-dehydrogenase subunit 3 family protein [Chloroflexota bacterium]
MAMKQDDARAQAIPRESTDHAAVPLEPSADQELCVAAGPLKTPVSRGRLLQLTGTGLKAGVVAYIGLQALDKADPAAAAPAPAAVTPPTPQTGTAAQMHHRPLRFFNSAQAAVITAMAERIFPADKTGPGATDAHVTDYIDGQLAGDWGWGARMYLQGPFFAPETSGHGWQIPLNPRQVYQDALGAIETYCQAKYKNSYDQLNTQQQITALEEIGAGKVPMTYSSDQFFLMFRQNVLEGLFADPMYGGNYNFIGWKWVRFPGNPMAYGDPYGYYIDKFNYPYNVAPKGLADQAF